MVLTLSYCVDATFLQIGARWYERTGDMADNCCGEKRLIKVGLGGLFRFPSSSSSALLSHLLAPDQMETGKRQ